MASLRAQACWIAEPGKAEIREVDLAAPTDGQALVRTLFSAISRGTETLVFEGRVPASEHRRMRAPFQEGDFPGPVKYGYINVGVVEEGPELLRGKEVFCLYPHQTRFVVDADALTVLPSKLKAERAVLVAGMETALNALWDAEPKIGDSIRVVGGGVIGCLCAYLAAGITGCRVELVDINPERESVARALGVEFATPENATPGADLLLHASGKASGLQTALGLAGREARIVELSWYGDREVVLPLGQAFHSGRLQLISSQVGSIPSSQKARWDYERRLRCVMGLLQDPVLDVLISGESDFDELPVCFPEIAASAGTLCHRIRYSASTT
jgi:2-desacetyl-2-hydroxyethyl bacteriochlorophyllide A dehydrogenase